MFWLPIQILELLWYFTELNIVYISLDNFDRPVFDKCTIKHKNSTFVYEKWA
jgi:hypothetical protein